ncbi:hypothetical protein DFH27DRAFT_525454 [Peziza echinospora]|nr:hypothetical protein DFH27DRAFT_525454 [Peziza echinospora]
MAKSIYISPLCEATAAAPRARRGRPWTWVYNSVVVSVDTQFTYLMWDLQIVVYRLAFDSKIVNGGIPIMGHISLIYVHVHGASPKALWQLILQGYLNYTYNSGNWISLCGYFLFWYIIDIFCAARVPRSEVHAVQCAHMHLLESPLPRRTCGYRLMTDPDMSRSSLSEISNERSLCATVFIQTAAKRQFAFAYLTEYPHTLTPPFKHRSAAPLPAGIASTPPADKVEAIRPSHPCFAIASHYVRTLPPNGNAACPVRSKPFPAHPIPHHALAARRRPLTLARSLCTLQPTGSTSHDHHTHTPAGTSLKPTPQPIPPPPRDHTPGARIHSPLKTPLCRPHTTTPPPHLPSITISSISISITISSSSSSSRARVGLSESSLPSDLPVAQLP